MFLSVKNSPELTWFKAFGGILKYGINMDL